MIEADVLELDSSSHLPNSQLGPGHTLGNTISPEIFEEHVHIIDETIDQVVKAGKLPQSVMDEDMRGDLTLALYELLSTTDPKKDDFTALARARVRKSLQENYARRTSLTGMDPDMHKARGQLQFLYEGNPYLDEDDLLGETDLRDRTYGLVRYDDFSYRDGWGYRHQYTGKLAETVAQILINHTNPESEESIAVADESGHLLNDQPDPEESILEQEMRNKIHETVDQLDDISNIVLTQYYNLNDADRPASIEVTTEYMRGVMGDPALSEKQVRRLVSIALHKLRMISNMEDDASSGLRNYL